MSSNRARWFGVGVPLLTLFTAGLLLALRIGCDLPWNKLTFPLSTFLALQLGMLTSMFWARDRAKHRGGYGAAIAVMGIYCWFVGLLIIHYGAAWKLLPFHDSDLFPFSMVMFAATAVTLVLFVRLNKSLG